MGLLAGGGAERSGGTGPVPEVPGVRVQLREFTVWPIIHMFSFLAFDHCFDFLAGNKICVYMLLTVICSSLAAEMLC